MSARTTAARLARAPGRMLRLLARPARVARGRGGVALQPYRGYGSREEVFLIGQVFRQPLAGKTSPDDTLGRAVADVGRRLLRRGMAGAVVLARFGGAEGRFATDRDGYFRVHLRLAEPPADDRLWHEMALELASPTRVAATGQLFIPPPACRCVVISDIDDTVMHTGVGNKLAMLARLFLQGAESRVAFPGVAAFLRARHHGASGGEHNPMLYVSRAPWSIYEVLDEFFRLHAIPAGPLLFLREWGLTLHRPLPRRGKGHKLELIRNMLALYRDLPFVLLGDSGQRDPEIYAQVVREHPGRVLAIYIRNVGSESERLQAIEALAAEVAGAGSSLVLAADSSAMAEHAAGHGLIAAEALAEVRGERREQEDAAAGAEPRPTVELTRPSAAATREAVEHGRLEQALERGAEDGGGAPPNVVVEPETHRRA